MKREVRREERRKEDTNGRKSKEWHPVNVSLWRKREDFESLRITRGVSCGLRF